MTERRIENARIESTMLGREDHGILTAYLMLDYGGSGQGFGGWAFDEYDQEREARVGQRFGMEFIARVLKVVGVERWEQLAGKHVRAEYDHGKVYRIGNILRDEWFDPAELVEQLVKLERE